MNSGRPQVMYGSFYYGQEAIVRNDDANLQFHRTETTGNIHTTQPIDSFESRRMQAIGLSSTSVSHSNGVPGPINGNFQGYGSVTGHYERTGSTDHNNGLSNVRDGFEFNRPNYQVYGRQPLHSFGDDGQRSLFAGAFGGPPPNSFAFGRQPPPNSVDCDRQGPNSFAFGGQQSNSFDFRRQPPSSFEIRNQREMFGCNNIDVDDARRTSSSWDRRNYEIPPTSMYDFERRQPGAFEKGEQPTVSIENSSQGGVFINEDNSDHERSKLMFRIKKMYDKDTIAKNSERFNNNSWVKVSYMLSGGLKIYSAQMTCPICLGRVSPYNRETEPGRVPRWELGSVKRHVLTVHKKKGVANVNTNQNNKKMINLEPNEEHSGKETEKNAEPLKENEDDGAKASLELVEEIIDSSENEMTELADLSNETKGPSPIESKANKCTTKPVEENVNSSEDEKTELSEKKKKQSAKPKRMPLKESKGTTKPVEEESESSEEEVESSEGEVESSEEEEIELTKNRKKQSAKAQRMPLKKNESKNLSRDSSTDSMLSKDSTVYSSSESDVETVSTDTKEHNKKAVRGNGKEDDTKKRKKIIKTKKLSSKKNKISAQSVPDWNNPKVIFGWVKCTLNSRFRPAFIFPLIKNAEKQLAQLVQTNGELSDYKHPIDAIATEKEVLRAKQSKKAVNDIRGVNLFNKANNTNFE